MCYTFHLTEKMGIKRNVEIKWQTMVTCHEGPRPSGFLCLRVPVAEKIITFKEES